MPTVLAQNWVGRISLVDVKRPRGRPCTYMGVRVRILAEPIGVLARMLSGGR